MQLIKSFVKKILNWCKCMLNHIPINCTIHHSANIKKAFLEGLNKISRGVNISNSRVGFATYIGINSSLYNCEIGKYCSIASSVKLAIGKHPTKDFISTHPAFYSVSDLLPFSYVKKQKFVEFNCLSNGLNVSIGNDVWIGSDVTLFQGVSIGDGAIIGAGAVVTKDIPPFAIVAGVPTKIIRYRFDSEDIKYLINFKWWNKGEKWIKNAGEYFDNMDNFKNYISTSSQIL